VTQHDVDLARRITEIAADHKVVADPASVSDIELGLDTPRPGDHRLGVGRPADRERRAQGRGDPQRRDPGCHPTGAEPVAGDADEHEVPGQRFRIEV